MKAPASHGNACGRAMKYLLYGCAGLGIGLVLGVIAGSIYTSHLYDVAVKADPVREDDLWGLVNFTNELSGGFWGASGGLLPASSRRGGRSAFNGSGRGY